MVYLKIAAVCQTAGLVNHEHTAQQAPWAVLMAAEEHLTLWAPPQVDTGTLAPLLEAA